MKIVGLMSVDKQDGELQSLRDELTKMRKKDTADVSRVARVALMASLIDEWILLDERRICSSPCNRFLRDSTKTVPQVEGS